ncbi:Gluconolactonase precursor [Halomonas sp. THAF12]|uniref:SMP-30/gluconolactonase/LRE family protein n=1 Tax=Halomonas sp. THAF12 TaxID=2587849 RepID=UPI0012688260|nr:SMP-30/gluconolactonase/LRE family protein [Halomonas sp. THAF12]QFT85232.1 Gluconolactonase precursor [Halomonas sp. THAF12]
MKSNRLEGKIVTSSLEFPEGPIAMADGSVLVVEIKGGRLTRVLPNGELQTVAEVGGGPNGAAIGPDGFCYICNNGGFKWHSDEGYTRPVGAADDYAGGAIQRVDIATGRFETLYSHCDGETLKGPNDIVFDDKGGFWFTDFGKKFDDRLMLGRVYYAKIDGDFITCAATDLITPNGVGISPIGETLYVSETETSRLWCYPILGEGVLGKEPWPSPNGGKLMNGLPGYQRFDSMAVEAGGNICVATLVEGGVNVFSPQGELIESYSAPEGYCTNICFGGDGLKTAYITLSGCGQLLSVPWNRSGLKLAF